MCEISVCSRQEVVETIFRAVVYRSDRHAFAPKPRCSEGYRQTFRADRSLREVCEPQVDDLAARQPCHREAGSAEAFSNPAGSGGALRDRVPPPGIQPARARLASLAPIKDEALANVFR